MLRRKKNRNLWSSVLWKCIDIVNPTNTTLFLYHFKSFTIPSGRLFRLLGKCVRTPRTSSAYEPEYQPIHPFDTLQPKPVPASNRHHGVVKSYREY